MPVVLLALGGVDGRIHLHVQRSDGQVTTPSVFSLFCLLLLTYFVPPLTLFLTSRPVFPFLGLLLSSLHFSHKPNCMYVNLRMYV